MSSSTYRLGCMPSLGYLIPQLLQLAGHAVVPLLEDLLLLGRLLLDVAERDVAQPQIRFRQRDILLGHAQFDLPVWLEHGKGFAHMLYGLLQLLRLPQLLAHLVAGVLRQFHALLRIAPRRAIPEQLQLAGNVIAALSRLKDGALNALHLLLLLLQLAL